jgi:hypothetical protein
LMVHPQSRQAAPRLNIAAKLRRSDWVNMVILEG